MSRIFKNIIVASFIILSIIFMIIGIENVLNSVKNAVFLWSTKVFPVLFPFYIFSSLAIKYGVAHFIGNLIHPITKRLFKTSSISGFVFIMSLISGNPSSAIIISQLYEDGSISQAEAQHLLSFCVFANPLFCIGTIGYAYYHNASLGYIVLISHVAANIIIGIMLRGHNKGNINLTNYKPKIKTPKPQAGFGETMTNILQNGINTMFLIAGFMIFYNLIVTMLSYSNVIKISYNTLSIIFHIFNIDFSIYQSFFIGFFEMVIGIDNVINNTLPLRTSITIITMLISFGGLSIHSQIQSILIKVKLKYYPFLISRIMQMIFSGIIAYYIFPFIYQEKTVDTTILDPIQFSQKNIVLLIIIILIITLILMSIISINRNKKLKASDTFHVLVKR